MGKLLDDFLVHRIPALCQHSKSAYVTFAMMELQSAHTAESAANLKIRVLSLTRTKLRGQLTVGPI